MNMRRVWAVTRKEFLHIIRDRRSIAMAVAMPMLMLVLFGYALSLDVDNVPLVVWDQSRTTASRDLVERFAGSRYFSLKGYAGSYREVNLAIDERRALLALVIPSTFAGDIASGRGSTVQAIADASDSNTATIALGYADAVITSYSERLRLAEIHRRGVALAAAEPPLEVRPRVWYNPEMESRNYIIPGLVAVIMMVIAALLTSLTVAREWERGSMEQLISTPLAGRELILGKLIPYFAIGMLDVAIAVLMGEFLFGVPLRGSAALLFAMAAVFLAGSLSMGMAISVIAKSQVLASQFAMVVTFLPSFILSGFMYSIANMPRPIQIVTYVVPARYLIFILRGIYLKGVGLRILAVEAMFLVVFGVAMVALAAARFRKKLE